MTFPYGMFVGGHSYFSHVTIWKRPESKVIYPCQWLNSMIMLGWENPIFYNYYLFLTYTNAHFPAWMTSACFAVYNKITIKVDKSRYLQSY